MYLGFALRRIFSYLQTVHHVLYRINGVRECHFPGRPKPNLSVCIDHASLKPSTDCYVGTAQEALIGYGGRGALTAVARPQLNRLDCYYAHRSN